MNSYNIDVQLEGPNIFDVTHYRNIAQGNED